ncbi:MAG: TIGR03364 family FAD-dependent oxidoreductase [Acidobacteria bacterium]|nr:TIGR03364 family FAD-dependent oxidoreductase [Acidobacteriota bacterium]
MNTDFDLIIVGSGIVGLAHASVAARQGKRVAVFDRYPRPLGASIRNFGMLWPIGQPAGHRLQTALNSRKLWLEFLNAAGIAHQIPGCLHAAYRDDETTVLKEFAQLAPTHGYQVQWLTPEEATHRSKALNPTNLQGALWSDTEVTVDPRQALATLPGFLAENFNVTFLYQTAVTSATTGRVQTGKGQFTAPKIYICSGEDFETLYPELLQASGITRVKLQMLRTPPQPQGWHLGPSLAAGLTLIHYKSFQICPSLPQLSERIHTELPEYVKWGIHVMASSTVDNAITIGDSHEYGLTVEPFNKDFIDQLILDYLKLFATFPDNSIAERWYGVYAKHPKTDWVDITPCEGVRIFTSPGGAGMTLSFGLAAENLTAPATG